MVKTINGKRRLGVEPRDLCTCGHQRAVHHKSESPKANTGYVLMVSANCAFCYCEQFKKGKTRFLKRDLSPRSPRDRAGFHFAIDHSSVNW
jgi:hypothetical protein